MEWIKIRILYILQKHKKWFKIQPPFNCLFHKCCISYAVLQKLPYLLVSLVILFVFTKNKTLDAFVSKQIFQSAMLIPSAALDICSEKILGDRKVWLWVSETDTTVFLVTKKCKGSYLAVYGLLSWNNSLLTETQFSADSSSPSADVRFFNPFFFPLFSSLPAFF